MWTWQMNLEAIVYGFLVTNVISCVVSDKIFLKTICEVVWGLGTLEFSCFEVDLKYIFHDRKAILEMRAKI